VQNQYTVFPCLSQQIKKGLDVNATNMQSHVLDGRKKECRALMTMRLRKRTIGLLRDIKAQGANQKGARLLCPVLCGTVA
jgi:hypothetical protein